MRLPTHLLTRRHINPWVLPTCMAIASDLAKGSTFEHHGELLRVVRKEVVAVGTHSHTKLKLFCRPLLGGGEKTVVLSHSDKIEIRDIQRKSGTVIAKLPEGVQLMDTRSYETIEAGCAPELLETIIEGNTVIFVDFGDKVLVIERIGE